MKLLWKYKPFTYLSFGKKNIAGRNNTGKITNYHRGGGHKKKLRIVDYKRYIWNLYAIVLRIEFDPNRSSLLCLIAYSNGIFSYILAPENVYVGDRIFARDDIIFNNGNTTYLRNIPIGIKIHNIELKINQGAQFIRAAGCYATIISKYNKYVIIKLKSGELRKINSNCIATIGTVSNFEFKFRKFAKAGYYRLKGWKPIVRGVAMNPVDHPHGGGQGKTAGGRPSVTSKGFITKGKPTKKKFNKNIIKKRN